MEPHSLPCLPPSQGTNGAQVAQQALGRKWRAFEGRKRAVAAMQSRLHAMGPSSPRVRHNIQGCWESSLAQGGGDRVREAAGLWGGILPVYRREGSKMLRDSQGGEVKAERKRFALRAGSAALGAQKAPRFSSPMPGLVLG